MQAKVPVQGLQEHPGKARSDNRCHSVPRHYHKTVTRSIAFIRDAEGQLTPYRLQHGPFGQEPQTLLPLPAPHVPSVVSGPVGGAGVGLPNTGS